MRIDLIDTLWKNTKEQDGCWLYQGTQSNGYGRVYINPTYYSTHRLSLCIYLKLDYKGDWLACHLCKNITCWNPLHIYAGTAKDNVKDAMIVGNFHTGGAVNRNKTHCPKGHEYTPENTRVYRGMRHCKLCNYLGLKERRAKKRLSLVTQFRGQR